MAKTQTRTMQVFGKWFYHSQGQRETTSVPGDKWQLRNMVPGQYADITTEDEATAKRLNADTILLGHGETFQVNYLD